MGKREGGKGYGFLLRQANKFLDKPSGKAERERASLLGNGRADILVLRLPALALLHIIMSYRPSVVAVFFGNYIFLGLFMLQCEKSFVTLQPIKAIEV